MNSDMVAIQFFLLAQTAEVLIKTAIDDRGFSGDVSPQTVRANVPKCP